MYNIIIIIVVVVVVVVVILLLLLLNHYIFKIVFQPRENCTPGAKREGGLDTNVNLGNSSCPCALEVWWSTRSSTWPVDVNTHLVKLLWKPLISSLGGILKSWNVFHFENFSSLKFWQFSMLNVTVFFTVLFFNPGNSLN